MNEQILFLGVDVDDKAFHAHGRFSNGEREVEFKCKPRASALVQKLKEFREKGYQVKTCYEATYLGFSLHRELKKMDFECDVIAPSLIPTKPGDKVKTDKLDSRKLSEYYKNEQLTIVRVPSSEQESIRDLIRSRIFIKKQVKAVKLHILSMCRRLSWQYREPGTTLDYWTIPHRAYLEKQIRELSDPALKFNIVRLIEHLKSLESQVENYDSEIKRIAIGPEYKKKVEALCCFRGIDILTAMVFIVEIWDVNRFDHPKRLASYSGMDLIEDSSGGKEKKYRMTKMGNSFLRTAAIESCQNALQPPRISKLLKKRRASVEMKYIEIADRCMKRLHKKATRMLYAGKMKSKIKVACARELLCFVWESLRAAA